MLFSFLKCTKNEVDIITSFEFEITEDHKNDATINIGQVTRFNIEPKKIVTTTIYEYKYVVNKGSGSYSSNDQELIPEDQWIATDDLNFILNFIGNKPGEVELTFSIKDNSGREEQIELKYLIKDNPFSIDLNTINPTATINESKNFTVLLNNTGTDENITYTANLFLAQGNGTIELLDDQGAVIKEIEQDESFKIEPGIFNYQVTLEKEGVSILKIEIVDSNGQKQNDQIELAVNVINFNFTGVPEKNSTTLGSPLNINFNISEIDGGNDTYKMGFVIDEGEPTLFSGSSQLTPGVDVNVSLGNFTWVYKPTKIGTDIITFNTSNTSGVSKKIQIKIEVIDRSFSFESIRSKPNDLLGNSIVISNTIEEIGGINQDTYTLKFESSSNGVLIIDDIEYSAGENININNLNFITSYKGLIEGNHDVTLILTSDSNNFTQEEVVKFNFDIPDFNFTVLNENRLMVSESIDLDFSINELSGNSNYRINYTIQGTNQIIKDSNGTILRNNNDYDVSNNNFKLNLEAIKEGNIEITFNILNEFDRIKSETIEIEVTPREFDFSISANTNNATTRRFSLIKFEMEATNTLTYELSFKGSGVTKFGGKEYKEGEFFTVPYTDFEVDYKPEFGGTDLQVDWIIKASNSFTVENFILLDIIEFPIIKNVEIETEICDFGFGVELDFKIEFSKQSDRTIMIEVESARTVLTFNTDSNSMFSNKKCYSSVIEKTPSLQGEYRITLIDNVGSRSETKVINL